MLDICTASKLAPCCFSRRLKFEHCDWLTVALETCLAPRVWILDVQRLPEVFPDLCVEKNMAFSLLPRRARFPNISSLVALAKRFNSDLVETEQDGKIFHVVIARPEKRNAVNSETAKQLADAFRSFEVDEDCKVAVFYGKGSNFCAGYDLEELSKRDPGTFLRSVPPVGEGDAPMVQCLFHPYCY